MSEAPATTADPLSTSDGSKDSEDDDDDDEPDDYTITDDGMYQRNKFQIHVDELDPTTPRRGMVPLRLLSAVAVIGRENEPLYLSDDLITSVIGGRVKIKPTTIVPKRTKKRTTASLPTKSSDAGNSNNSNDKSSDEENKTSAKASSSSSSSSSSGTIDYSKWDKLDDDDDDESTTNNYDPDPSGFFTPDESWKTHPDKWLMSMTKQAILWSALDYFEERIFYPNGLDGGTVRWRSPPSITTSGMVVVGGGSKESSMYLGCLKQIDERYDIHGYVTNTGIKFMIVTEDVYLMKVTTSTKTTLILQSQKKTKKDGGNVSISPQQQQQQQEQSQIQLFRSGDASFYQLSTGFNGICIPPTWNKNFDTRELDIQKCCIKLHDMYVQHTMNPFIPVGRSCASIKSSRFHNGIGIMANEFNLDQRFEDAIETITNIKDNLYGV